MHPPGFLLNWNDGRSGPPWQRRESRNASLPWPTSTSRGAGRTGKGENRVMLPYLVSALVAIPVIFILSDLAYSLMRGRRYRRWETTIERDAEGCATAAANSRWATRGCGPAHPRLRRFAVRLSAAGPRPGGERVHLSRPPSAAARPADGPLPNHQRRPVARRGASAIAGCVAATGASSSSARFARRGRLRGSRRRPGRPGGRRRAAGPGSRCPTGAARSCRPTCGTICSTTCSSSRTMWACWTNSTCGTRSADVMATTGSSRAVFRELFGLLARNRNRAEGVPHPASADPRCHDQVVDNAASERFFNDCASQPKRLIYVEKAGHMLPIDYGWENLVDEAARFFEGVGEATAPRRRLPFRLGDFTRLPCSSSPGERRTSPRTAPGRR